MVNIRSTNDIIAQLIDYYQIVQNDLDTKPGTVARDLFVDGPASQVAILYDELGRISDKQSIRLVSGTDLDKLAQNFAITRRQPSASTGTAIFTFSSIDANVGINAGDLAFASNGFSFTVSSGASITPASSNLYRSIAAKYRDQLDFAGISDEYAVLVTVSANATGTAGNIGSYSLNRTNIPGVSNVTNVDPFGGGTNQEGETAFRNRVLSTFSGSSVGTALGYLNTALSTDSVLDATVIEPGNPLMTRDGTITLDGVIISEGTGGKVDVAVLGSTLIENTDTFIYRDKSNDNDPANEKNDFVLGQIESDAGKSISRKRIDDISTGVLPSQPVDDVVSVTGSLSGGNFAIKTTDEYGRVSGNFELAADPGVYGGSPWGFDTFKWVSNKISNFGEDRIKGQYNSQDSTTYTDLIQAANVTQNISITNENSSVTSNRAIIQLLHTPATNVTRVFNVNTGEIYLIINQNIDSTLNYNVSGLIEISGNTLPSVGDVLQVDYNWVLSYDRYSDYDGLVGTDNIREVTDSIDWGYSSLIREELVAFNIDGSGDFFQGRASNPVGTVVAANKSQDSTEQVTVVTIGIFINRLAVVVTNLEEVTSSVDAVKLNNSSTELYATESSDGTFINSTEVVNGQILNITSIILPTDTYAVEGDSVKVSLNNVNVFSSTTLSGTSNANQITIPATLVNTTATTLNLKVQYISSLTNLFSTSTTTLPAKKLGNGYNISDNGTPSTNRINVARNEHQVVQENLSFQKLITLEASALEYVIEKNDILSVVRVSDGAELWSDGYQGTVEVDGTSYNLIFSGVNTPLENDNVLVIYYSPEIRRYQPFTFENKVIQAFVSELVTIPLTDRYEITLNSFTTQLSGLSYNIVEPNTDIILLAVTDGYLIAGSTSATLHSATADFSTIVDIEKKKVIISKSVEIDNDGTYDVVSYSLVNNTINIANNFENLTNDQVSVTRVADGADLWINGIVDVDNNKLTFDKTDNSNDGDVVFVNTFNYKNLRQSPTIVAGTITDQVVNAGVVTVTGTTLTLVTDTVITVTTNGLTIDLSAAVRASLGLSSSDTLPTNIKIANLMKAEKVVTVSSTNNEVLLVEATYDVFNTKINDNTLYSQRMVNDDALNNFSISLPPTPNNTLDIEVHNLPKIGDKLRVSFYFVTTNDADSLSYTRNGTLYTNKRFAFVDRFYISSGFKTSQSTKFTGALFTQPTLGSRYKSYYDYVAPKQNERVVIKYNYNKTITDVTLNLEATRPVNSDVLARQAKLARLDLVINVVIGSDYLDQSTTVLQNLRDKLTTTLTTDKLGDIVDTTTIINEAESVTGIARARIIYFNETGELGTISTFQANEDQFFTSNQMTINTETR